MNSDNISAEERVLSAEEIKSLEYQNSRLVSSFKAQTLELEAQKNWDLFYKRNETRFFKDRHWTVREFNELLNTEFQDRQVLLEIGCGVGNLIYPLVEENANFYIYACDLSPRAVEFVKTNPLYNEAKLKAFQTDITTKDIFNTIKEESVDVVTLIFVLSAVHPDKFTLCLENIYHLLKPGGVVLFRDYALHDMAQIRFKPGHKIAENFYMRQDGTRSYYFSRDELEKLFSSNKFETLVNNYVQRRTVNKKEGVDKLRTFIQGKFRKPNTNQKADQ